MIGVNGASNTFSSITASMFVVTNSEEKNKPDFDVYYATEKVNLNDIFVHKNTRRI